MFNHVFGSFLSRSNRVCSMALICCRTNCRRCMSRSISARVFGGRDLPSGVTRGRKRSEALRNFGLKMAYSKASECRLEAIDDAGALTNEILVLVRTLRILLLQRWDRHHPTVIWLAPQPSQGRPLEKLGIKAIGLRPTVLSGNRNACRWITWASMPRTRSQRASQNPSRPASKVTTIRLTWRSASIASCFQRSISANNLFSSASNFFRGCRSTPGTPPATSQDF
jgi:hypothetical protein